MKKSFMGKLFLLFLAMLFIPINFTPIQSARPTHLRVGLVDRFSGRGSIGIDNTAIRVGASAIHSSSGFTVRPYGSYQIVIYGDGVRSVMHSSTQVHDAYGNMISLEGTPYRGAMEFMLAGGGITAVNIVSIEEYLFSVVPSEMPATWHPEALKAQAVAARTYAWRLMERGGTHVDFDLCNMVCCQVYRGAEWEHENSTEAVLATAGQGIFFNGELIEAVYFASSGGVTENSENVWTEARPYLRSLPDIHEFEPVIWTRTFTLSEINSLLAQNNRSIGSATGVSIGGVHPSGRVMSLIIHGTAGQVVLEREEIRTFFSGSAGGSLQSRNFVMGATAAQPGSISVFDGNQVIDVLMQGASIQTAHGIITYQEQGQAAPVSGDIIMSGRGFGHGVGMSQRGAEGMARRGYTFRDILTHFYSGTTIH